MEGYVNLFTARTRQTSEYIASLPQRGRGMTNGAITQHGDRGAFAFRETLLEFSHHRL
jgi:hypothetical protein